MTEKSGTERLLDLQAARVRDEATRTRELDYLSDRLTEVEARTSPAERKDLRAREIADGLKLAIKELAHDEPETLRQFLMAIWEHTADGASRWAGRKLLALVAGALFAAALWLLAKSGGIK